MNQKSLTYELLPASLSDLSQLGVLEKACFPMDAWPWIEQIAALTFPATVRIKAVHAGSMVGFIGGDIRRSRKTGWITTLAVLPTYRRMGIGEALLRACEQALKMPLVRLSVRRTNLEAQLLYMKNGYHKVETWRRYYEGGEDAIVMEKTMSEFKL
jgi:ribosomal-protein-alanine N-acetyltransferase